MLDEPANMEALSRQEEVTAVVKEWKKLEMILMV
jgi:hypothetical protein